MGHCEYNHYIPAFNTLSHGWHLWNRSLALPPSDQCVNRTSSIYKSTPRSLVYFTSIDFKYNKTLLESSIVLSTTITQVNLWLNPWSVPLALIIWLREWTKYIHIFNRGRHFYRWCVFIISNLILLTINRHTVVEMF